METIYNSIINGHITAPASKSVVQRSLIASLLSNGTTILKNYTPCDDSNVALSIIQKFGAKVTNNSNNLNIIGNPPTLVQNTKKIINCGESGLLARLFSSISLLYFNTIEINGEGSLLKRPFTMLKQAFEQYEIECCLNNNLLPIYIKGQLTPKHIKIDGSISSQFLSGLLISLPLLPNDSQIDVINLKSKPYIDLTIDVLKNFGIYIENKNYEQFYIKGKQNYHYCTYNLEGDWSAASCLLVAGAVAGNVEIKGLKSKSHQADRAIIEVLQLIGAIVIEKNDSIQIQKNNLNTFNFDATDCPDLFPALTILAANCNGVSKIKGINRLINKESNRALAIKTEMEHIGVKVEIENDIMIIYGGKISGGDTFAHNDHRIAMAMAIAGLTAQKPVTISGTDCVNKSYPNFFIDLHSISTINQ